MGLPQIESCCFVLDLKTGSLVMGCLNATYSFIMMVTFIVEASMVGAIDEEVLGPEEAAALTGLYSMSIILVLMFLAKFLLDVVFIYGVNVERAGIIKSYCIMWLVFFILSLFTFFINIAGYSAWTITVELLYICFNIYSILIICSFYKQLNMREVV